VVSCLDGFDWWLLLGFLLLRRGGVLVVGSRLVVCNGSALFSDFPACETLACHCKRSRAGDVTVVSLCDSVLQPGLTRSLENMDTLNRLAVLTYLRRSTARGLVDRSNFLRGRSGSLFCWVVIPAFNGTD
jgi:hypothetical protein